MLAACTAERHVRHPASSGAVPLGSHCGWDFSSSSACSCRPCSGCWWARRWWRTSSRPAPATSPGRRASPATAGCAVKAGWLLLAAAVWGGAIAALVTWWSGPRNALFGDAFQPNYFDLQGIVPVGYAVFATALGIAAGAVLRRTLPAIAIVIGGFIGMRLWISQDLRMHFMAPVTAFYGVAANLNTRRVPSMSGAVFSTRPARS